MMIDCSIISQRIDRSSSFNARSRSGVGQERNARDSPRATLIDDCVRWQMPFFCSFAKAHCYWNGRKHFFCLFKTIRSIKGNSYGERGLLRMMIELVGLKNLHWIKTDVIIRIADWTISFRTLLTELRRQCWWNKDLNTELCFSVMMMSFFSFSLSPKKKKQFWTIIVQIIEVLAHWCLL